MLSKRVLLNWVNNTNLAYKHNKKLGRGISGKLEEERGNYLIKEADNILSSRCINALLSAGYVTTSDICDNWRELASISNFGISCLYEVVELLYVNRLHFNMDEEYRIIEQHRS